MDKLDLLKKNLAELGSVLVAYSGGVDSTLLLAVAYEVLGDKVLGVTATSELMSEEEAAEAQALAEKIGVRHLLVPVADLENEEFSANSPERCYHCKKYRLQSLQDLARKRSLQWIIEGSNVDDLQDYRPGHKAVAELGVKSPLQEAGLTKAEIRELARIYQLPVWNKPSKPCLATRIPYGTPITKDALERIRLAETYLIKTLGLEQIRVREHGSLARLEIPPQAFAQVFTSSLHETISQKLKELGYAYVTLDLLGYRQGSMNEFTGEVTSHESRVHE